MAWYYGTYSCGHEGRTNIIGPMKHRQWKADAHFRGLCPECFEKKRTEEREKARIEALEKAKKMELPELEGSEKQIAWAVTLRQEMIDKIDRLESEDLFRIGSNKKEKQDILDYVMSQKKASWFIDNRSYGILFWLEEKLKEIRMWKKDQEIAPILEDIKKDSTVYPENCGYKEPAEIKVSDTKITVTFSKNENFRKIVKSLGYTWGDGYWYREINKFNGPAEDRAAELGNKLLNAGFPIMITDNSILQNAISGNYNPEQKRWIKACTKEEHKEKLAISWEGYNDDLYKVAKKLPSAKWHDGSMVVKVNYWQEVEDFANLYGFAFSDSAKELIEQYKASLQDVTVVTPASKKEEKPVDGLKKILESSEEILDDLKD